MKTLSITTAIFAVMVGVSCSDPETGSITTAQQNAQDVQRLSLVPQTPTSQVELTSYFQSQPFNVLLTRLSKPVSALLLDSEEPIHKIFSVADLSNPQPFNPVLGTIVNRGLNMYCMSYLIIFNDGVAPRQLYSTTDIEHAMANGEIVLINTEQIYSCVFL
jgi:hypothetical protein